MTGRLDLTRIYTFNVEQADLLYRLNTLTDLKVVEPFAFGVRVYSRARPPPVVCSHFRSPIDFTLPLCVGSDQLFFHRNLLPPGTCKMGRPSLSTTPTVPRRIL